MTSPLEYAVAARQPHPGVLSKADSLRARRDAARIVRAGMADVLEWLGESAPAPSVPLTLSDQLRQAWDQLRPAFARLQAAHWLPDGVP